MSLVVVLTRAIWPLQAVDDPSLPGIRALLMTLIHEESVGQIVSVSAMRCMGKEKIESKLCYLQPSLGRTAEDGSDLKSMSVPGARVPIPF